MSQKPNPESHRVDCTKCMYFYVTWDPDAPRGCHFYNFKSPYFPSVIVFQSSGERCLSFVEKKKKK